MIKSRNILFFIFILFLIFLVFKILNQNPVNNHTRKIIDKESNNKVEGPIKDLKSLQVEKKNFKKEDKPIGRYKRSKFFDNIDKKKSSFKILPGSDILEKYDYNDRDVKKTLNDFVKDPSVEGEVKIKF